MAILYIAELSEVLWNMVFSLALRVSGAAGVFAVFALFTAWAGI